MEIVSPLKKWRLGADLTQEAAAEKFSVTQETFSKWERGEVTPEPSACVAIESETGIHRSIFRPDIFESPLSKPRPASREG